MGSYTCSIGLRVIRSLRSVDDVGEGKNFVPLAEASYSRSE
jgi:hypothetical protein